MDERVQKCTDAMMAAMKELILSAESYSDALGLFAMLKMNMEKVSGPIMTDAFAELDSKLNGRQEESQ